MVKLYNDGTFIIIELNDSNNVLQKFYSVDYFDLIGIQPDVYASNNSAMSGGYYQDTSKLTVPYKYLVKFLGNNNITAENVDNNLSIFTRGYEKLVSSFNDNKKYKNENVIEPEVIEPEVIEPEVIEPEVIEPEVIEPEVIEPEVIEPEVIELEVIEPEVIEPEVIEPEVIEPEVIEPEVIELEVIEPEVIEPEVIGPEVIEPEVIKPEVIEPEVIEPEVIEPEVIKLEVIKPEVIEPEFVVPETVEPEDVIPEDVVPEDVVPEDVESKLVVIDEEINKLQKLILKFKIEPDSTFNGSLKEVMDYNIENYSGNIELNTNGLFYNDIVKIYEIKKFINMSVNQKEVYRINGKFIVIKEFLENFDLSESIDELDVSMMENTYLTEYLRKNIHEPSNFI
jgi:hypothetical protein